MLLRESQFHLLRKVIWPRKAFKIFSLTVILQSPLLTLILVLGFSVLRRDATERTGTKSESLTVNEKPELEPLAGNCEIISTSMPASAIRKLVPYADAAKKEGTKVYQ